MKQKRTIDLESVKWHVLLRLHKVGTVSPGDIKSDLLGSQVNYDDVYDSLFKMNRVYPVAQGIELTDEGRSYVEKELSDERKRILQWLSEDDFKSAVLEFLYHRPHLVNLYDFPDYLVQKAPSEGNSVGLGGLTRFIYSELKAEVEQAEQKWYGITQLGRDMFDIKKRKSNSAFDQPNTTRESAYSTQEAQELNAILNQILAKLDSISLENETIWTDIKADFEELRDHFNLGKKNWRQLLTGKLTDWVAGGLVSETISKQIIEAFKPAVRELM